MDEQSTAASAGLAADISKATAGGEPAANFAQFLKNRRRRSSSDKSEEALSVPAGFRSILSFRPVRPDPSSRSVP